MKQISDCAGSALIYILIAIALLGLLTASLMDSSSQQTTSQNGFSLTSELNSQINFIRSAIQECVLVYPAGDTTMPPGSVGGNNVVRPYPLMPNNTYLAYPTVGTAWVKDIKCPGNPGNSNNHAPIFQGSSGKFFPPTPKLFSQWQYYNSDDGVLMIISTNKTDAYIGSALSKLDTLFSPCEAGYIDASGGDVAYTSGGHKCPSGSKCFVVRIMTRPSTIYPQETGTCP